MTRTPWQSTLAACALSLFLAGLAFGQSTKATADDDLLLQAMQAEMQRSKAQLKLEGMSAPYYID
jgi:hypothetical protein